MNTQRSFIARLIPMNTTKQQKTYKVQGFSKVNGWKTLETLDNAEAAEARRKDMQANASEQGLAVPYRVEQTGEGKAPREQWIRGKAYALVASQGYSDETAKDFAQFAIEHCPEVQGFQNLFDYYMSKQS